MVGFSSYNLAGYSKERGWGNVEANPFSFQPLCGLVDEARWWMALLICRKCRELASSFVPITYRAFRSLVAAV